MKILDLSYTGKLNDEECKLFNEIAYKSVNNFNFLTDSISQKNQQNKYWWYSNIASRDTATTPFFFYFVSLCFLTSETNNLKNYDIIITDSLEFLNIIKKIVKENNLDIEIKLINKKNFFSSKIRKFLDIFKSFTAIFLKIIICKFLAKNNKLNKDLNNGITLIDTYLFDNFYKSDRYYGNFYENIPSKLKKNIYFAPTIISTNFHNLIRIYNYLGSLKDKYILKENYIKLIDLIELIKYHFFKSKIDFDIKYNKYDLGKLIKEIYYNDNRFYFIYESLLTYKFIINLSKANIKIKTSINWYENQIIDKAWNLGFNKYFPDTILKGYRGIVPPNLYISQMYPTEFERMSRVLPKKIIVIGKGFINETSKYLEKNIVEIGPALRFENIFKMHKFNKTKQYKILILLPSSYITSKKIINELKKIKFPESIKFIVRQHPFTKQKLILNNNFSESYKNLYDEILDINLIICNYTSAALELLSLGINLIYFNPSSNLDLISIPKSINENIWKLCYNNNSLKFEIMNFYTKKISIDQSISSKIISNYFNQPSTKNILEFLEL